MMSDIISWTVTSFVLCGKSEAGLPIGGEHCLKDFRLSITYYLAALYAWLLLKDKLYEIVHDFALYPKNLDNSKFT